MEVLPHGVGQVSPPLMQPNGDYSAILDGRTTVLFETLAGRLQPGAWLRLSQQDRALAHHLWHAYYSDPINRRQTIWRYTSAARGVA